MNLKRVIKREIAITTIITVSVLTALLSVSYAIYFAVDEKNIGSVTFGQITFDACMDESCSTGGTTYGTTLTANVYPMNTTEGTSQTPYLFKVTNNGISVMNTRVYAAKEGTSSDYTNVKLAAKVQGTSTYSYANLTQDTSILIDLQVPVGQSKIIEVYMWLDEEASNDMLGKTITAFINAMGYYKPDDPNNLHTGDTYVANVSAPLLQGQTFSYTGNYQEFEAPISGYYFIETWGAQGGASSPYTGGKGGYSSGNLYLSKGEKIYIYVGEHTTYTSSDCYGTNPNNAFNGALTGACVGGGGATDIRYFGDTTPSASDLEWSSTLGLNSRIMVAGGGGSQHYAGYAGVGGTLIAQDGYGTESGSGYSVGVGGTQTSGGNFGIAHRATTTGGNGYYSGNGGVGGNAGGGSSFISGYAGSNAITSASDRTHTNNTLHYSGKYFLDGTMKSGIREGNGQATIRYVGAMIKTNTKLDGVRYIKDCVNGSSYNANNHWVEVQAIKDGTNIAKNKAVTATSSINSGGAGTINGIADGDINSAMYVGISGSNQCVTVDLGTTYDLDEIAVWHYYADTRAYYNNITSVSSDNSTWTELIKEALPESSNGKRVSAYSERVNGYIQDGLLVWYDGISNTGTTRSTSTTTWKNLASSSYDGTITSGTWGDKYLSFNGTSSWVKIAELNPANFTADIIFKQNATSSGYQDLLANWQTGGIALTTSNNNFKTGVHYGGAYKYNTDSLALGTTNIYSYTSVFNQASLGIYRFGSFVSSLSIGGAYTVPSNSTVLALGADPNGTSASAEFLNGNIYAVRFYNRALTADEIYHNYLIDKERFNLD